MRVRLATRKMCVSTAMVGSPKAVFRMTLAVFRPTPGSLLQRLPGARHLATVLLDEDLAGLDDVLGFAVEEPDGADVTLEPGDAQGEDLLGSVGHRVQLGRGLVDAYVGGLGREHHGDQQLERVDPVQLGGGARVALLEPGVDGDALLPVHGSTRKPSSSAADASLVSGQTNVRGSASCSCTRSAAPSWPASAARNG